LVIAQVYFLSFPLVSVKSLLMLEPLRKIYASKLFAASHLEIKYL